MLASVTKKFRLSKLNRPLNEGRAGETLPFTIMTKDERANKADELIGCLGMWGISVADAQSIAYTMVMKLKKLKVMPNILEGTGMVPITSLEQEQNSLVRSRIFHEPQGEA